VHLFGLYLHQISTDLDEFWCTRKQNTMPNLWVHGYGFGTVFCLRVHQNSSKSVKRWWRYSSNTCAPIFVVLHYFCHKLHSPETVGTKGPKNPCHALPVFILYLQSSLGITVPTRESLLVSYIVNLVPLWEPVCHCQKAYC